MHIHISKIESCRNIEQIIEDIGSYDEEKMKFIEFHILRQANLENENQQHLLSDENKLTGVFISDYSIECKRYYVEIDIKEDLYLHINVEEADSNRKFIKNIEQSGVTIIQGCIESTSIYDYYIKGEDFVINLDIHNLPLPFSGCMKVIAKTLYIYGVEL